MTIEGFMGNSKPEMKKIEGSDNWLGGPEMEEVLTKEASEENLTEQLKPGVGLDGTEYDVPEPRESFEGKNKEFLEDADIVPEYVEDVAEMMLPILEISISRGVEEGWDDKTNSPTVKFIEIEGADLEKAVSKRIPKRKEACIVYELLKNKVPAQKEREQIVRDAILERASLYCPK